MSENLTLQPVAQPDGSTLYALGKEAQPRKVSDIGRSDLLYGALGDSIYRALIFLFQKPVPVSGALPAGSRTIRKIPLRRRRRRARGELKSECSFK